MTGLATRILGKEPFQTSLRLRTNHEARTHYPILILWVEQIMGSSGCMTHVFDIRTGSSFNLAFLELEILGTISVNILNHELDEITPKPFSISKVELVKVASMLRKKKL